LYALAYLALKAHFVDEELKCDVLNETVQVFALQAGHGAMIWISYGAHFLTF
jgi:hypothetical protein